MLVCLILLLYVFLLGILQDTVEYHERCAAREPVIFLMLGSSIKANFLPE
jgi:hypothetical protein